MHSFLNGDNGGLKETGALQEEYSAHRIQGMLIPQDHQRVCIYPMKITKKNFYFSFIIANSLV